ncbi:MAG TPA: nuclear transport factor 2 family protein [Nitrososphaera sp.]
MSNEDIVRRYFKLIESKNLDDLVDMFDYEAVLKEPFSNMSELKGSSEIAAFLKVALMANSDMRRKLEIKANAKNGKTRALVTFEKGDKLKGQFTFDIDPETKKITALKIEFLT